MKHKLINFDIIVNNLIVHNLLINYLNLKKKVNTEAAAHQWSVTVVCNQPLEHVVQNRCSYKFRNILSKTPVLEHLLQIFLRTAFS